MDNTLEEVNTINLGDKRRNKRFIHILKQKLKNPSASLPITFERKKDVKGAYRFFDNPAISADKIVACHRQATIERIQKYDRHGIVLLVQDSSDLNYSNHASKKELGKTQIRINHGLLIHPTIAVTPEGVNLGLVDLRVWTRKEKEPRTATQAHFERSKKPIEEKESYKWIDSFLKAEQVAKECPKKRFISVADRDGDIYDLFLKASESDRDNLFFLGFLLRSKCA